jgi:hypothetical protein
VRSILKESSLVWQLHTRGFVPCAHAACCLLLVCLQPGLLKLLASLGAGFDCASKAELEAVLAMGVDKDRIIFAHPCKRACDLRFARDAGIQVRLHTAFVQPVVVLLAAFSWP